MTQTLASDMVRRSLDAILERVERPGRLSGDAARELLDTCVIPPMLVAILWDLINRSLNRGIEGKKLVALLRELQDVLDLGLRAYATTREKVVIADLSTEEQAQAVLLFDRATASAMAI